MTDHQEGRQLSEILEKYRCKGSSNDACKQKYWCTQTSSGWGWPSRKCAPNHENLSRVNDPIIRRILCIDSNRPSNGSPDDRYRDASRLVTKLVYGCVPEGKPAELALVEDFIGRHRHALGRTYHLKRGIQVGTPRDALRRMIATEKPSSKVDLETDMDFKYLLDDVYGREQKRIRLLKYINDMFHQEEKIRSAKHREQIEELLDRFNSLICAAAVTMMSSSGGTGLKEKMEQYRKKLSLELELLRATPEKREEVVNMFDMKYVFCVIKLLHKQMGKTGGVLHGASDKTSLLDLLSIVQEWREEFQQHVSMYFNDVQEEYINRVLKNLANHSLQSAHKAPLKEKLKAYGAAGLLNVATKGTWTERILTSLQQAAQKCVGGVCHHPSPTSHQVPASARTTRYSSPSPSSRSATQSSPSSTAPSSSTAPLSSTSPSSSIAPSSSTFRPTSVPPHRLRPHMR